MRSIIYLLAGILYSAGGLAQISHAGNMFRNDPSHTGYIKTSYNLVYDTKLWSFFAGSPVRSTPLIYGSDVYFGDAKGDFFCIDRKTGYLKWRYNSGEAIHSSAAAHNGKVFFSDNRQTVYALAEKDGKLLWRFDMGKKIDYP